MVTGVQTCALPISVRENGGHLGSSLGAVELTMALLRRFDPLHDRIVFDVGHQVYPYKLLTDRADRFDTLRLKDGICGFPRRSESPCDHFNTGHSSTSVSAALGYAKARDLLGQDHHVVAFTGDAALINGLAFEALNHVKETKTRLIIVPLPARSGHGAPRSHSGRARGASPPPGVPG